jgi:hypothetical protein
MTDSAAPLRNRRIKRPQEAGVKVRSGFRAGAGVGGVRRGRWRAGWGWAGVAANRNIEVLRVGEDTVPVPLVADPDYDEYAVALSPEVRGRLSVFPPPRPADPARSPPRGEPALDADPLLDLDQTPAFDPTELDFIPEWPPLIARPAPTLTATSASLRFEFDQTWRAWGRSRAWCEAPTLADRRLAPATSLRPGARRLG